MRHIKTLKNLKSYLESCDQITITREHVLHALETVLAEYEAEAQCQTKDQPPVRR